MSRIQNADVLVVGAGPVGLYAALALGMRGVRVAIVDEEVRPSAHSYALALHPQSLQLLDELGLAGDLLQQGYRVRTVSLFDGSVRQASWQLSRLPTDFSFLLVTRQDSLESMLVERLKQIGIAVHWNHRVSQVTPGYDHVAVTIDRLEKATAGYAVPRTDWEILETTTIEARYVLGADGQRSIVRRALGADYAPAGHAQQFAVFEFATNADFANELTIVLRDDSTNVIWPLPGGFCRCSFEIPDAEIPAETRAKNRNVVQIGGQVYPGLEHGDLENLLSRRLPWFTGSVGESRWAMAVRFENRLSSTFGSGRMWLAGDAAHMTGPVGVQSMNVGFREARVLVNGLVSLLEDKDDASILEEYEQQFTEEWRLLLGIAGGLMPTAFATPWIRQNAWRLVSCMPCSGPLLEELAQQIGMEVRPARPMKSVVT